MAKRTRERGLFGQPISEAGDQRVVKLALRLARRHLPDESMPTLAVARDDTSPSYDDGVFTSVRHWGEQSNATWKVRLRNTSTAQNPVTATWNNAELRLYGTE